MECPARPSPRWPPCSATENVRTTGPPGPPLSAAFGPLPVAVHRQNTDSLTSVCAPRRAVEYVAPDAPLAVPPFPFGRRPSNARRHADRHGLIPRRQRRHDVLEGVPAARPDGRITES